MKEYAIVIAGGSIDDDFALRFLLEHLPEDRYGTGMCCPDGRNTPGELSGSEAGYGTGVCRPDGKDAENIMLVAADRGLVFLDRHRIVPDLIVGDFDSAGEEYMAQYRRDHPGIEIQSFSWEKDYTDTEIAARAAVERGCRRIDIIGATGTRFDHVLGSVQLLATLLEEGVFGRILDPYNRITIHRENFRIRKADQWGKYVSFFAWGGEVRDVTLRGFHFPMKNGTITPARTLTVSNQIEEESAEVTFRDGTLLMVESKDTSQWG